MIAILGQAVPEKLLEHIRKFHNHGAENIFAVFTSDHGIIMTRSFKDGLFVVAFATPQGEGWEVNSNWVSLGAIADLIASVPEAHRQLEPLFERKHG